MTTLSPLLRVVVVLLVAGMALPNSAASQARWRLEEIVRIGGEDEGLASFNQLIDVALGADGKIWVLDRQVQSLRLFEADGTPIKEVARRGAGPGEITRGNGLRAGPDGTMWVRDQANQRVAVFNADGSFKQNVMMFSSGYGWRWDGAIMDDGRVLETIGVPRGDDYVRVLRRMLNADAPADTAQVADRCGELPPPQSSIQTRHGFVQRPFAARILMLIARDGSFWCAHTDEYAPRRFAFGGATAESRIRLAVPRVPVPAAERDSVIAEVERFIVQTGGAVEPWDKSTAPRDVGAIYGFNEDDRGRLWVVRKRPDRKSEFDVWERNGRRVATMDAPTLGENFPLLHISNGRLVAVTHDEDDLPVVIVYRIREN
jgi:hypothetical protein